MLGLSLTAAKSSFFDRKMVIDAVGKATHDALSRFGAFVMTRARTSLRYRKGTSSPGSPPFAHRSAMVFKKNKRTGKVTGKPGSPLREFILFAYDSGSRSVVIGPILLKPGSKAPALLEYGGPGTVRERLTGKVRTGYWRARPFMRPALEAERHRLPPMFRNTVR